MLNQSDPIAYPIAEQGFDNAKYVAAQTAAIAARVAKFDGGKLYLEVGGKFLFDAHASRVLPGFEPTAKQQIFQQLGGQLAVIFCVNHDDIVGNRQLGSVASEYAAQTLKMVRDIADTLAVQPQIAINLCPLDAPLAPAVADYRERASAAGFATALRYRIAGYPQATAHIASSAGYGADDYIATDAPLVLVLGAASNSGKLSTCLGQIYHDHQRGEVSGYAKYETFPIWDLPLEHPINLAYEAATADIGDYNELDDFHFKAYGVHSVNYNRDIAAFELVRAIANAFVPANSPMRDYASPTDMGINCASAGITDDDKCRTAATAEIARRRDWYAQIIARGEGEEVWLERCDKLMARAK